MSAYLIYDVEIHDPDPYGQFMEQVKPLVESFGGRYLVRGGAHEVLEGDWHPTRLVMFEFPDMEAVERWHKSDDYKPLLEMRLGATRGNLIAVNGV